MNTFGVFTALNAVGTALAALVNVTLCRACFIKLLDKAVAADVSILQVGLPALQCAWCPARLPLVQRMGPGAQRLRAEAMARRMAAEEAEAERAEAEAAAAELTGEQEALLAERSFADSFAGWAWQTEMGEPDWDAHASDMDTYRKALAGY